VGSFSILGFVSKDFELVLPMMGLAFLSICLLCSLMPGTCLQGEFNKIQESRLAFIKYQISKPAFMIVAHIKKGPINLKSCDRTEEIFK
jgi:hypothetical protein